MYDHEAFLEIKIIFFSDVKTLALYIAVNSEVVGLALHVFCNVVLGFAATARTGSR
jgi:hypothetical protein